MKLNILVFAAHPDDAELSCSGTILKHISLGYKVGIVDLTRGELGSRGSAEIRDIEAKKSSNILGLTSRDNLDLGDGFFEIDQTSLVALVKKIREYRPDIVFCNAPTDRHPDHGRASKLASRACFLSGLLKIDTNQEVWRPRAVYHYIQDRYIKPDFSVDITEFWDKKLESIHAFSSQFFDPNSDEPETPISAASFMNYIEGRAKQFGREINAEYAEGFIVERVIGVDDVLALR
jgi:bacillithiol biosynthesis deacetylase BshB1